MDPVMRSDFVNCLLFLDRLQRDSCFHFRAEAPPLPRSHSCSVSEAAILHLIAWSEFWGAPQRSTRPKVLALLYSSKPLLCHLILAILAWKRSDPFSRFGTTCIQ